MRVKKILGLILGIAVAGMVSDSVYAEDASITMSVSSVSVNVIPSDLSGTVATSDTGGGGLLILGLKPVTLLAIL